MLKVLKLDMSGLRKLLISHKSQQQRLIASHLKKFAFQTFGDHSLGGQPKPLDPEIAPDLQSSGVSILGNPKGQN